MKYMIEVSGHTPEPYFIQEKGSEKPLILNDLQKANNSKDFLEVVRPQFMYTIYEVKPFTTQA